MKSQYLVGADSLLEDVIQVHQLLGHHLRVLGPDQVFGFRVQGVGCKIYGLGFRA